MRILLHTLLALLSIWQVACQQLQHGPDRSHGTLLIIGGGLDNDLRPIYERLVELAGAYGPAKIVIVTAATGPEEIEIVDKTEALRVWAPGVPVSAIRRATSTADSVAAIESATALLFTGGDQQRITDRYRPEGRDTAEWSAMQRLLARGGVIAGCSAGDAMMGELMLLGGSSAAALGIAELNADRATPAALGPRVGPGMRFLPWAITDSHFFERDRVGRLIAALEATKTRLGVGVGEDGCVEVDLGSGTLTGVAVAESLLVDTFHLQRDGQRISGILALPIEQGQRVSLIERLAGVPPKPASRPTTSILRDVPVVEPGQNRQLASWRIFRQAARRDAGVHRLLLDGWELIAWPASTAGEVVCEVGAR
jgi:cyanophycinase